MKKNFMVLLLALAFILNLLTANAATLYGDVNFDGKINSIDYALLNRHILGTSTLTDTSNADVTGEGSVNSTDYALFRRYLLGIISVFPIQTAEPSPTPVVNPEDAWKENTGTINLSDTITYTGTGISVDGTTVNITSGGDHEVTGTLSNGMIHVNTTEKVKLRLSGVNITNITGPAIYFENADKSFITITEETTNNLVDGITYNIDAKGTLFSNDDLEIKGKGTLNITGNYKHGIVCDDALKIENGNITIAASSDGIHVNNSVKIKGGDINITAGSDGIDAGEEIEITGGTITITADGNAMSSDIDTIVNDGGIVNVIE